MGAVRGGARKGMQWGFGVLREGCKKETNGGANKKLLTQQMGITKHFHVVAVCAECRGCKGQLEP